MNIYSCGIITILREHNLTVTQLSKILDVTPQTIKNWKQGCKIKQKYMGKMTVYFKLDKDFWRKI